MIRRGKYGRGIILPVIKHGNQSLSYCYLSFFLPTIFGHWYDVVYKRAGPLNPIIIEVAREGNKPCFRELNYWPNELSIFVHNKVNILPSDNI